MTLARTIRDSRTGALHTKGEAVIVTGHWLELGTHRDLLRAQFSDGTKTMLLPDDVEGD